MYGTARPSAVVRSERLELLEERVSDSIEVSLKVAFLEVLPPVIAPALVPLKQLHRHTPLVVLQCNVEQLVLKNGPALTAYPFVAGNETGELLPQGALQLLDNVILPPLGVNIAVLPQAQVLEWNVPTEPQLRLLSGC